MSKHFSTQRPGLEVGIKVGLVVISLFLQGTTLSFEGFTSTKEDFLNWHLKD